MAAKPKSPDSAKDSAKNQVIEGDTNPADETVEGTTQVINDPSDDKVEQELNDAAEKRDERKAGDPEKRTFDTGPNRQGNAYGVSDDAKANFKADLEAEKDRLKARLEEIDAELKEF